MPAEPDSSHGEAGGADEAISVHIAHENDTTQQQEDNQ